MTNPTADTAGLVLPRVFPLPARRRGAHPTATHYDRRGPDDGVFGYVYFDDGARVWYGAGMGIQGGGWEPVTTYHRKLARDVLKGAGLWAEVTMPQYRQRYYDSAGYRSGLPGHPTARG